MYSKATADELAKLLAIVNSSSVPEHHRAMALDRMKEIKDIIETKELIAQGVPEDRAHDVLLLLKEVNNPLSLPEHRARARISLELIRKEITDRGIRSMRKSLIKQMKDGRYDNVKDISEDVVKNKKYTNDRHNI